MVSYTGVVKNVRPMPGELFPWINSHAQQTLPKAAARYRWEVFEIGLTGTAVAIGTDDYSFLAFVTSRTLVVATAFVVDPVGLSVDATNYNTFTAYDGTNTLLSLSTAYGLLPNMPAEIRPANTILNRYLPAGIPVYIKVTGTVAGRVINHGTKVYIVCYWA